MLPSFQVCVTLLGDVLFNLVSMFSLLTVRSQRGLQFGDVRSWIYITDRLKVWNLGLASGSRSWAVGEHAVVSQ